MDLAFIEPDLYDELGFIFNIRPASFVHDWEKVAVLALESVWFLWSLDPIALPIMEAAADGLYAAVVTARSRHGFIFDSQVLHVCSWCVNSTEICTYICTHFAHTLKYEHTYVCRWLSRFQFV